MYSVFIRGLHLMRSVIRQESWNEAPTVGSFVLFLFYFTMCYGHYIPGVICDRLRSYNVVFGCL